MGYWECEDRERQAAMNARWRARWLRLPRPVRLAAVVAAWVLSAWLGFVVLTLAVVASHPHP